MGTGIHSMIRSEFLYGYVDDEQYVISNNVEQICAFIMKNQYKNVKITNVLDVTEIDTVMGFLNYCADQEYLRNILQPAIIPFQRGEVEPPEFVEHQLYEDVE